MKQVFARAIGGVALIGLLAGTAACNKDTSSDTASGSNCGYKLAFFGALTGSAANLGVNIEQGFELAVNQYNEKKGSTCIEVAKFDSQGAAEVAPGVARQLVADKKILGIVGPPFSGESEAADPIFAEAGIPTITPSATRTSLSSKGWKIFHRAVANDDAQGPAAAAYIKDTLKAQKVFVADDQSAYGAGLAEVVKSKLGPLVVNTDKTEGDGKQADFSALVQKVTSSGATAFFYGGYYTNAGLIRKQLTAAGWKGTLLGGDGMKDPGLSKASGNAAAVGTVVTCPCSPPEQAGEEFNNAYKTKWNTTAGTYSDVAYDAANIFLQGIEAGNTTPDKLNTYLSTVNYKGIANTYKWTAEGELDPTLIKVWAFKFDESGDTKADAEIKVS
ncbi:branched-chain amino acid transport system substrate-binding protein [Actinoplanes octamycinicus]|uniref:Branched-chain amino acid transport system substrate-binding protein n=1 Tax=Actinoplanes octamycinicus TaxID=135948 RepID=A0A7W7M7J1_9ACTN|nr:branched-chain amino acid ABC transporter substrate-binding protein [Actinoplanes octamycinicus]MBB4739878.1 branched-chain amino acid transport system substrate-binding protein [Actinoplanes octamycinicus]GIE55061.1 branched chain amino acid ABC transporter substrate-binding protein [Actinoplanes octamycinicus]